MVWLRGAVAVRCRHAAVCASIVGAFPAGAIAYAACESGWCLDERRPLLEWLNDRTLRFYRVRGDSAVALSIEECRLDHPDRTGSMPRIRFECGRLLVELPPDVSDEVLSEIGAATEGTWDEVGYGSTFRTLLVRPGTERAAILNAMFHPALLYMDLSVLVYPIRLDSPATYPR